MFYFLSLIIIVITIILIIIMFAIVFIDIVIMPLQEVTLIILSLSLLLYIHCNHYSYDKYFCNLYIITIDTPLSVVSSLPPTKREREREREREKSYSGSLVCNYISYRKYKFFGLINATHIIL